MFVMNRMNPHKLPQSEEEKNFKVCEAGLFQAMHEFHKAMSEGDMEAAARAFHNAFQLCEAAPHEEHEEEPSYKPPEIE